MFFLLWWYLILWLKWGEKKITDYFSLKNTNVRIEFNIFGDDFSPDIITEKLGIIPTKTWLKNDPLPKRKEKLRKDCYWGLYIGYEESIDIMIQIEQLKTMRNQQLY